MFEKHRFDFIVPGQLMPAIYTFYPTRNGVLVGQGTFTHDERSFTLTLPVMVMRQGIVDVITDVYQLTPPQQGWLRWYVRTHAKDHDGYGPVKTDSIPEPEVATGWNP